MKIEVTIPKSVPSNLWHKVATKQARSKADKLGINWIDAEVFIRLPEHGRCMTKDKGYTQLISHG